MRDRLEERHTRCVSDQRHKVPWECVQALVVTTKQKG